MGTRSLMDPSTGPFTAGQVREGDRYELSEGHPLYCSPAGGRHAGSNHLSSLVIGSDPAAEEVGIDAGYAPKPGMLRAPDLSVGKVPDIPGWVKGVPPLAIEHADEGQDEPELQQKIRELLAAGTRHIWVVRLVGPRRVEIYEPERPMRRATAGELLQAPGILKNPVPVEALYNKALALDIALQNLLQRRGIPSLDEALREARRAGERAGEARGKAEAVLTVLAARGLVVSEEERRRVLACADLPTLERWLARAATEPTSARVFADPPR